VTVLIACGFVLLYAVVTLAARAHAGGVAGFYPWDAGIALSVALLARFDLRWAPLIVVASLFAAFIREGGRRSASLRYGRLSVRRRLVWWRRWFSDRGVRLGPISSACGRSSSGFLLRSCWPRRSLRYLPLQWRCCFQRVSLVRLYWLPTVAKHWQARARLKEDASVCHSSSSNFLRIAVAWFSSSCETGTSMRAKLGGICRKSCETINDTLNKSAKRQKLS
jgi:hypothetical protein